MVYNGLHEYGSVHKEWYTANVQAGQVHRGRMIGNIYKDAILGDWNMLSTAQKERYKASARLPETGRIPRNGAEPPLPQQSPEPAAASPSEQPTASLASGSAVNTETGEQADAEQIVAPSSTPLTLPGLGQLSPPNQTALAAAPLSVTLHETNTLARTVEGGTLLCKPPELASKRRRSDTADEQRPISKRVKTESDKGSDKLALLEKYASGTRRRQRESDSRPSRSPKRLKLEPDEGSDIFGLLESFLLQPDLQPNPDPVAILEPAGDVDDDSVEPSPVNSAQTSATSASEIFNLVNDDDGYGADVEPFSTELAESPRSLPGYVGEESEEDTSSEYPNSTNESLPSEIELLDDQQPLKRPYPSTPAFTVVPSINVDELGNLTDMYRWVMQWAENADGDQRGILDKRTPTVDGDENLAHTVLCSNRPPSAHSASKISFSTLMSDNEYFFGGDASQSVSLEAASSPPAHEYGVRELEDENHLGRGESQFASLGPNFTSLTSENGMSDLYYENLLAHGLPNIEITPESEANHGLHRELLNYDSGAGNAEDPAALGNHASEGEEQYATHWTDSETDYISLGVDSEDNRSFTPDEPSWLD